MHYYQQKLRKTLMYSEGTCCEPEGTFASTKMCCCLGGGEGSKIVVPNG